MPNASRSTPAPAGDTKERTGRHVGKGAVRGQDVALAGVKGKTSRKSSENSPAPQQCKPQSRILHRFPDWVDWFLAVPFAAVLSVVAYFLPDTLWIGWKAFVIAVVTLLVLTALLKRRAFRVICIVLVVAIIATGAVTWRARQPTQAETAVDELYESIRDTPYWQNSPPLMYPRSRQFIIDHFAAFDPASHHAWSELVNTENVTAADVVLSTNVFDGKPITTVGISNGGGQVGNQILVQLQPVETMRSPGFDQSC